MTTTCRDRTRCRTAALAAALVVVVLASSVNHARTVDAMIPSAPLCRSGATAATPMTDVPNTRPIIGMLTQPVSSDPAFPPSSGWSYLPASYVKWIESAGGRVAAIPFDADTATLAALFCSVNGLLLPGGDVDIPGSLYPATTETLVAWARAAWRENDDYMPVWGTCQGFEQLGVIGSGGNFSVLTHFDGEDLSLPLTLTAEATAGSSRLWNALSPDAQETLTSLPGCTENLHEFGIAPAAFTSAGGGASGATLGATFLPVATSVDRAGKEFVAMMEAWETPIYATQFHPERNAYEWTPDLTIDHRAEAVSAMAEIAAFFLSEARLSSHRFPSVAEETAALIYAAPPPAYTVEVNNAYEQTYFWPNPFKPKDVHHSEHVNRAVAV